MILEGLKVESLHLARSCVLEVLTKCSPAPAPGQHIKLSMHAGDVHL